ncbi:Fe-S cluster assembly ATP-binding protein [Algisphaera agarilytica]|uniref:Fe-S cluster assembly ATP-binding protein n=1 Tax=Algisphaera agarilytica TaxID=1385975 RepID=A0A7X0H5W1_9BACT|nr:Fe-S cluster assembly ATPase SufC [Algisphaera agarilytica]MBB6429878.1 Fe-S cluster assembly ATP-binding protein [Algisphaera agarilytica]
MTTPLLEIKNLHVRLEDDPDVEILHGVDLKIMPGEVHSIMGPNGSGKSTLSQVLAGKEDYEITEGEILFNGEDLSEMGADERANAGVFLAFQYPVEIPGVSSMQFLKAAVNAKRDFEGKEELDAGSLLKHFRAKAEQINVPFEMLKRNVNEGFSGGEKKRFEIFQMAVLDSVLGILDESDSGLDIDALRIVSDGVNSMRDGNRSFLLITHYQRLLDYIEPDHVHILVKGQIIKSGGKELATELEKTGYAPYGVNEAFAVG